VCIDDFAVKKREKYGTIMIDIETRTVVDMIESRKKEDVSQWLESYPNLQMISRDGSITYAKAISEASDQITQVSDRFHLIKNLTDYGSEYLKKHLKPKIRLPKPEEELIALKEQSNNAKPKAFITLAEKIEQAVELDKQGMLKSHICKRLKLDIRTLKKFLAMSPTQRETTLTSTVQKRHEERVKQKEALVSQVREMYQNGFSQRSIARTLHLEWKTVKRYLDPAFNPVHAMYGKKKASLLDGYHETIEQLFIKGLKSREIEEILKQKGYTASSGLIRRYISKFKQEKRDAYSPQKSKTRYDYINRGLILKLLYKPLEEIEGLTEQLYERFQTHYTKEKSIIDLIAEFKDMLKTQAVDNLEPWLNKAQNIGSDEINSFVNGIQRDKEAVINAIVFPYSNGLAEGKINKLKTIKRVMYGRCGFDTLRNKALSLS